MVIKPCAELRDNYRKVADFCIETGEPVFLTNEGKGELVVMSIEAWEQERQRLRVEEAVLRIESEEAAGIHRYISSGDVLANMDSIIAKAGEEKI